jgi:hypothetical protein
MSRSLVGRVSVVEQLQSFFSNTFKKKCVKKPHSFDKLKQDVQDLILKFIKLNKIQLDAPLF